MKANKQTTKVTTMASKVLKPLNSKKLESIVGGPETSRGTETNVQHGIKY